jgi:hypothetical protein
MTTKMSILLILLTTTTVVQADDLGDRVSECGAIENDATRLACFDGLATSNASVSPKPSVAPNPPAATEPVAEVASPPPAPENLGAETLRHKDRAAEDKEELEVSATVTRCSESVGGRHFFYFSNGQVWKQSKNDRVHFGDCKFDITITKDFFGYKMQEVGEKRRIRIKRVK